LPRIAVAALLLIAASPLLAQQMQVIELRYATAAQVIPVLEPLLDPGDAITGVDDKLFVRAGPAALERVQSALEVLDRRPRELVITVAQGTTIDASSAAARGSASVAAGDASIGVNRPPSGTNSAQVVVVAGGRQVRLDNQSSVRTVEGMEAWISAGRSVPYTDTWRTPGPGGTVQRSTTYRDVDTGFYALPRLRGDQVSIEISSRQQSLARGRDGEVRTAATNTVVTATLGTWVEIGAVRESGTGSDGGLLRWGRYTAASEYSAWLRVDAAQ
jgi:type II secretory pathway component GspD/PulD (secretin)